ncbi:amidohydrolase family protein [Mycolicibacterium wolinskyi]|uniref:amidohydrolase family protein n=1 Tax=Mycolicibacterium wolinskyi TaxID=59750 RepID=UPI003917B185
MRTITLEEHFATPDFAGGPGGHLAAAWGQDTLHVLCDLGAGRIAAMDAAGVDVQVLSLTSPGLEQLSQSEAPGWARSINDRVASAIAAHPTRLRGFAALPTASPEDAAGELSRAVTELGFLGAMVNGHVGGRYLDDEFFWPILAKAEQLQVPIYLHPTMPPQTVIDASYTGNFSAEVGRILAASAWGWHMETGNHLLRMVLAGVFDRFPRLQVMIGHLGEALPFMLPRIEQVYDSFADTQLERRITAYFRENVHYTIAGFNFVPSFLNLLLQVGADRILFSADYPYTSMEDAQHFLRELPISESDRHKIAHGNAESLFDI